MSFNPSEARLPAGAAGGGRWGAGGAPQKGAANPAKKAAPASRGAGPGHARNAAAAKAQADPNARAAYAKLMATSPDKRRAYLHGLSSSDLEALTAIAYSSRTSDPKVVAARIAVANEMTKRGIDIKKHGALGGGLHSSAAPAHHKAAAHRHRKVTPAQRTAVAKVHARKAATAHKAAPPMRPHGGGGGPIAN